MKVILFVIVAALCVSLCACNRGYTYEENGVKITVERKTPPALEDDDEEEKTEYTSAGTPINRDFDYSGFLVVDTPESDCFSEIAYNSRRHVLIVTFRDSIASYAYYAVPNSVWDDLRAADSKGGYYNSEIKGYYDCEKLE